MGEKKNTEKVGNGNKVLVRQSKKFLLSNAWQVTMIICCVFFKDGTK